MKTEKEFNLEERVNRLERKMDFIFETLEDIKYDLYERKIEVQMSETKLKKEDLERLLQDLEMQHNFRWERKDEDRRRYQGVYETNCEPWN
jgi:hypothetical protein